MVISVEEVNCVYVSCACNCVPHAADWGNNGLICYGACNSVAIYDPKDRGGGRVTTTLYAHKNRVNSVRWVRKNKSVPETELVSGSTDQLVIVWSSSDGKFCLKNVLKGHEGSVTIVDAFYRNDSVLVVASASVDSTVRIWERRPDKDAVCASVINLNSGLALSVRLVALEYCQNILLACGTDDCKIHLYTLSNDEVVKLDALTGHEDWVRSLDFTTEDSGDLLLASGSQDTTIRLWRFQSANDKEDKSVFRLEEQILSVSTDLKLTVRLEAVLSGHDSWVYGVHWHPPLITEAGDSTQPLKLLSASMDKTVIIWSPEEDSGVWLENVRVGEVGGNTLGFYGGFFGPNGKSIIVHGFQGGFHMWRKKEDIWTPSITVGGHFNAVTDIGWESKHGRYLISTSNDQTTRLHASWLQDIKNDSWHEIARPQVHGYDLVCLAILPNYRFASGADEKVVRAFVAPQNFLDNFKRLCVKDSSDEITTEEVNLPQGAAVPALGLSNKAVFENGEQKLPEEKHIKDQYENAYFIPQKLTEPPTEDNLMQNTLWPEVIKLYGHGYEVFSLAATSDGKLLASACKATNSEHAAILLWDTHSWQKVGRLPSHQLTVTQLCFSPDDKYLLSVSRDRRWSLFQKQSQSSADKYKLLVTTNKTNGLHTRIIWCCSWTHDSKYFATGSREGKVVVWGGCTPVADTNLMEFGPCGDALDTAGVSVTSLAFYTRFVLEEMEYLCAVGFDSGGIALYGWMPHRKESWRLLHSIEANNGHHLTVKKLAFRPQQSSAFIQLASCGLDHIVKVHEVYLKQG